MAAITTVVTDGWVVKDNGGSVGNFCFTRLIPEDN